MRVAADGIILLLLLLLDPSVVSAFSATTTGLNVGFERWVSDAPEEVITPQSLQVKGEIPSYVQGSLVRNGGGIWSLGDSSVKCAHIFDGMAKMSRYQVDGSSNTVQFSTRFVDSKWKEAVQTQGNVPSVHIGPLVDTDTNMAMPQSKWIQALFNIPWFDNTPVNVWKFDPTSDHVSCLTDTPIRATVDQSTLQTLQKAVPPPAASDGPLLSLYEITGTAHPQYCQRGTGASYNVGTQIALPDFVLCLIKDNPDKSRQVVGQYPLPDNKIPYMHSFGLTPSHAIVVLQPLRQNSNIKSVLQEGFLPSMENVGTTKVIVFDLETGDIVADATVPENIYSYHSISAIDTKDGNGVSLKLCAYSVPDIITGEDQFFRFDRTDTREGRNRIHPGGRIGHLEVKLSTNTAQVDWIPVVDSATQTIQGFELPTTRYSRTPPPVPHVHPQFAYAFGAFARGSPDYDAWAILKLDTTTGRAVSFREGESCYYSEPIFVPDPNGSKEDDGVLLFTRFDGTTEQTSLAVLNAANMELLAEANTHTRVAMDFHGAFFPSQ